MGSPGSRGRPRRPSPRGGDDGFVRARLTGPRAGPDRRDPLDGSQGGGRPARRRGLLLAGAVIAAALLGVRTLRTDLATAEFIVRDSAGLTGLAALGAVVGGRQYAWTLPAGWFAFAYFAPPATSKPMQAATWMMLPPDAATGIRSAAARGRRHRGLRRRGTEAPARPAGPDQRRARHGPRTASRFSRCGSARYAVSVAWSHGSWDGVPPDRAGPTRPGQSVPGRCCAVGLPDVG